MTAIRKAKKKKIKGQIPGTLYAWLVACAERRRCRVSKVLEEIAAWICEDPDRDYPSPLVQASRNASGSHTYLNFNADEKLLEKWERFKEKHGLKSDSQTIRMMVQYRHSLAVAGTSAAVKGKPTSQQQLF